MLDDPRVLGDVGQLHALSGFLLSQPDDDVACLGADVRRECRRIVDDLLVSLGVTLCLKRRLPDEELEGQNAELPDVDRVVVRLFFDHLGRQVVERPAEGLPAEIRGVDRPAKVPDFDLPMRSEHEVFGLDVPVDDVLGVAEVQCACEGFDVLFIDGSQ